MSGLRRLLLAVCLAALATGCRPGPGSISSDRFDYSAAVSDSWKRQMLLNIVKMRYLDPPIFLDVGQIVAGYTLETNASLGGQLSSRTGAAGNFLNLGTSVTFIDRPTITYTPLTGNKFVKGLMTPLSPTSVFFLIQTGLPADAVLYLTSASLCGLRNEEASVTGVKAPNPDFVRALTLLRKLQLSDSISMRILQDPKRQDTTLLLLPSSGITEEVEGWSRELRQLLHLDPQATELNLVFAAVSASDREVALRTRSLLQIMNAMAVQVEVPQSDVAEGRAIPGLSDSNQSFPDAQRVVRIKSSRQAPGDPFVAVSYRDTWFYIDDRDLLTKRAFAAMIMLFTLADTGEKEPLPLITIPTQ